MPLGVRLSGPKVCFGQNLGTLLFSVRDPEFIFFLTGAFNNRKFFSGGWIDMTPVEDQWVYSHASRSWSKWNGSLPLSRGESSTARVTLKDGNFFQAVATGFRPPGQYFSALLGFSLKRGWFNVPVLNGSLPPVCDSFLTSLGPRHLLFGGGFGFSNRGWQEYQAPDSLYHIHIGTPQKHGKGCPPCGRKIGLLRCSCKQVAYCSRDHQKQDWPSHRLRCTAIVDKPKK